MRSVLPRCSHHPNAARARFRVCKNAHLMEREPGPLCCSGAYLLGLVDMERRLRYISIVHLLLHSSHLLYGTHEAVLFNLRKMGMDHLRLLGRTRTTPQSPGHAACPNLALSHCPPRPHPAHRLLLFVLPRAKKTKTCSELERL
jgi:hypothetical protein